MNTPLPILHPNLIRAFDFPLRVPSLLWLQLSTACKSGTQPFTWFENYYILPAPWQSNLAFFSFRSQLAYNTPVSSATVPMEYSLHSCMASICFIGGKKTHFICIALSQSYFFFLEENVFQPTWYRFCHSTFSDKSLGDRTQWAEHPTSYSRGHWSIFLYYAPFFVYFHCAK